MTFLFLNLTPAREIEDRDLSQRINVRTNDEQGTGMVKKVRFPPSCHFFNYSECKVLIFC